MNPTKIFCTRTAIPSIFRTVQLGIVFAGLACLVVLASVTTPASAQAVNFGSINVCPAGKTTPAPCSANKTVTFSVPANSTISSIAIVTNGAPNLDYKAKAADTSPTLCKVKTYSSASTCTVDVTFAPLAPGARNGAVELLDDSGKLIATTYIYGIGVGPQVAFSPSVWQTIAALPPSAVGSGGVEAVDGSGNLFVAVEQNSATSVSAVLEFLAADHYATVKTLYSNSPGSNLALDGAGNVFFCCSTYTGGIIELVAAESYAQKTITPSDIGRASRLVVDGSGNLFLTNFDNGMLQEIPAAGGYTTVKNLGSGLSYLFGLALDSAGNIFVEDTDLKEVLAAGGYTTVKNLGYPAITGASGIVSVDAADNIYLNSYNPPPDSSYNSNVIIAAGGYTTFSVVATGPGFNATDGSGNFYATNDTSILKLDRSLTPAFAFANTTAGNTSSDSPQSAFVQNTGTAALTGSASLTDSDFRLVAASGTPKACGASFSLVASTECSLNIDFTPQSTGALSGSLILTDNAGNATAATQAIDLSGTGVAAETKVTPNPVNFGSVLLGGSISQSLTITNIGSGNLTIDPSSNGPSTVIKGSTCGSGIAAGKSCTVQVEFKPVRLGPNSNTLTIGTNIGLSPKIPTRGTADGVGSVSTALDFGTIAGQGAAKTLPLTITNYGVPGTVTVATSTGAVSFKVVSNGCTAGVSAGESCQIEVEYAPPTEGAQTAYLKLIPSSGAVQNIKLTGTHVPY